MNKTILLLATFFSVLNFGLCQEIKSFHSLSDDSFKSWSMVYVDDPFEENPDYKEGQLEITWGINNDWSTWNYLLEDYRGNIRLRGNNISPYFELVNQDSDLLTAKNVWPRDFTEWKIYTGDKEYVVKQKYGFDVEQWTLSKPLKSPLLTIYTETQNDLRDWIIDFHSDQVLPIEIQQFAILLIIYNSCPKI